MVNGQWAMGNGQWAMGNGQMKDKEMQRYSPLTIHHSQKAD